MRFERATHQLAHHPGTNKVARFVFVSNGHVVQEMVTKSQKGNLKPNPKYALTALYSSLDKPRNLLQHTLRVDTMHVELQALKTNKLVAHPFDMNE